MVRGDASVSPGRLVEVPAGYLRRLTADDGAKDQSMVIVASYCMPEQNILEQTF